MVLTHSAGQEEPAKTANVCEAGLVHDLRMAH
jgi:hypothetical protein